MSKYLQDPEYLFSIITALVKKNNGKIVLSETELKEVDPQDMLQATSMARDEDTTYEN